MRLFFADCVLDTANHTFLRNGNMLPLEPQVFDLLHLLAERAGQLVTKDELVEVVWNGRIVSDATISARINAARTAVGDTGKDQRVIRTIPRRGIELVAEVSNEMAKTTDNQHALTQTVRYTSSADGTQIAYAISGIGPPLMRV